MATPSEACGEPTTGMNIYREASCLRGARRADRADRASTRTERCADAWLTMCGGSAYSSDGWEVPRSDIEKVLPYLADRHAYPQYYVEMRVKRAFNAVRGAKLAKIYSATEVRHKFSEVVRALRVIEEAKGEIFLDTLLLPELSVQRIGQNRRDFKRWAAGPMSRSGGKRNIGREVAVTEAFELLIDFGKGKRPGCTREGPWHAVAKTLYATEDGLYSTMLKMQKNCVEKESSLISTCTIFLVREQRRFSWLFAC